MTSYQKLKEERDEWQRLFEKALHDLAIAKNALWEIEDLKEGEEWKAPKMARFTLRKLRNDEKEDALSRRIPAKEEIAYLLAEIDEETR